MGEKARNVTQGKREVGRPSLYRQEFCRAIQERAEILAEGCTDTAIADALDVDVRTIERWRVEHEEFADACAMVKQRANARVEASLFKRSNGYSHPAVKIFMPQGADEPVYADYTEHYPPDTNAASLWLRNRDPNRWRDRIEHTGADGKDLPAPVTVDVLEVARAIGFALAAVDQRMRLQNSTPGDGAKVVGGQAPGKSEASQRTNLGRSKAGEKP